MILDVKSVLIFDCTVINLTLKMVAVVGVATATILTAGAAAPAAIPLVALVEGGAATGAAALGAAAGATTAAAGAAGAAAGAAATGAVAGAIGGAAGAGATSAAIAAGVISGTAGAAATSTAIATGVTAGAASGAAIGAATTLGPAAYTGAVVGMTNPIGWVLLGCDCKNDAITWDCWKPIIHYKGKESGAVWLNDFLNHPSIIHKYLSEGDLFLINQWQEKFKISYVLLPNGQFAAHAQIC